MENILPRREARENAFLLAFSQTFGDIPLQEALDNHHECDEEHPGMFLASACCGLIMSIPQRWTTSSAPICATGRWSVCPA